MNCTFCHRKLSGSGSLVHHMRTHLHEKPYFCNNCQFESSQPHNLKVHQKSQHMVVIKSCICFICGEPFETMCDLKKHQLSHSENGNYKCSRCGKLYKSVTLLAVHVRRTHTTRAFRCEICGKTFKKKGHLNQHRLKVHQKQKNVKCPLCPLRFFNNYGLKCHMTVHTGEKHYKCATCKKCFSTSKQLKHHMMTHFPPATKMRGDVESCSICNKKFLTEYLRCHMKTHANVKPFGCHFCPKSFRLRLQLTNHLATHTREKKYKCRICGRAFADAGGRLQHEKIHDNATKIHRCRHCSKLFRTKVQLAEHTHRHNKQYKVWCIFCSMGFVRPWDLKCHLLRHVKERHYFCRKCDGEYFDGNILKKHNCL